MLKCRINLHENGIFSINYEVCGQYIFLNRGSHITYQGTATMFSGTFDAL